MRIAFYGDSLTVGIPGASYFDLLRARLPNHRLINYGKINDTPRSLHTRILRHRLLMPVDLAFIWVGVNDVLVGRSWFFAAIRREWARNDAEFHSHYAALLDTLRPVAPIVVAVAPLFAAEAFDNPFNSVLARRAAIIEALAAERPNVRYLDLRPAFARALDGQPTRAELGQNLFQSTWDYLTLRTRAQVERAAARRGWHFTLDGVHLNHAGAQRVAASFDEAIRSLV